MEEKNNKVKLGVVDTKKESTSEKPQYTYEQLVDICGKQEQYIRKLSIQLQQANAQNMFKRLDYLFQVVSLANKGDMFNFDNDFVDKCIVEIQEALIIPEETLEEHKEA